VSRPNPVGWFLVAFFLIGGIAFTIAIPSIWIGQIWIVVALFLAFVYRAMSRRADRMEGLRQTGLPGTARVLEMTQTGVYINENPQVKMKLHIEATGIAPYDIEKKATVPLIALGALGSGRPLTLFVNPNDHNDVFIDWSGQAAASVAGPPQDATVSAGVDGGDDERPGVDRLMDLQKMRDKGLISEAEFEETKARILKSL
jgi:hypothetical protein